MPVWTKRLSPWLQSLRVKTLAILLGCALVAAAAGLALILGIRQADYLIARGSSAQHQLELLLLLRSRIGDYSLVANAMIENRENGKERIAAALGEVDAVFTRLEGSIAAQVALLRTEEGKNAEATEGLSVARMKAMVHGHHAKTLALMERGAAGPDAVAEMRRDFDILGLGLGPLISQAIEVERSEAAAAHRAMTALRDGLTAVAAALIAAAVLLSGLLYWGPLRSILRRIRETIAAAERLAAGALDARLELRGHDELTSLMASFNRMAQALAQRETELIEARRQLEGLVAARTAALTAANARLELIDQNRKRFFADVSHELRTPLTVILGESEVTLRQAARSNLPEAARRSIETIQERAKRLHRRVEDLLRVARSESGWIELNPTRMEAGATLADACEDVAGLARKYSIRLALDRGPGDLYVRGDKEWLRQVFGGIIANALKFSESGGAVEIRAARKGRGIEVEVSDEGCGVPPAELPKVFERFYRAANRDRSAETGHGVGLALAKWVIEEHRGEITIESPGRMGRNGGKGPGTTLRIGLAAWENGEAERRG